jgi:hypothetical protein
MYTVQKIFKNKQNNMKGRRCGREENLLERDLQLGLIAVY